MQTRSSFFHRVSDNAARLYIKRDTHVMYYHRGSVKTLGLSWRP
uniref:Uncharacterized protein n=1 Tax=Solanum lycopersicum TaxID=4081 RepID=K4AZR1_SOLLC